MFPHLPHILCAPLFPACRHLDGKLLLDKLARLPPRLTPVTLESKDFPYKVVNREKVTFTKMDVPQRRCVSTLNIGVGEPFWPAVIPRL